MSKALSVVTYRSVTDPQRFNAYAALAESAMEAAGVRLSYHRIGKLAEAVLSLIGQKFCTIYFQPICVKIDFLNRRFGTIFYDYSALQ